MKNKVTSAILIICMLMLSACGKEGNSNVDKEQQRQLYRQAAAVLQEEELKPDGSSEVTEELLTALDNVEYTQPQNIILMIGDGMGFNVVEAAQRVYSEQLYHGTLAMNYMPFQNAQCTYSASRDVTDSAAGATALATGRKTMNGVIAMDYAAAEPYQTILELAAQKGKSTGVIATKAVTDATPAAFTAHVSDRKLQAEIASMQLEKIIDGSLDLVLGGGSAYYEQTHNEEILAKAMAAGVTYTESWDEASASSLPVVGLFSELEMDTLDDGMPSVAEMTDLALSLLSDNEEGFFLMVEGSQIDSYGEKNNFEREVKEVYDFDCAVAVAMRYVALNPDTVLIVTADHETGDLWIPAEPDSENIGQYEYTTVTHTNEKVPVFAAGYGVEALSGIVENTDIAILLASFLGEENFGTKSTIYDVSDKTETAAFDETNSRFSVALGGIPGLQDSGEDVEAFHITVKNAGDTILPVPVLILKTAQKEYTIEAQVDYIEPGETLLAGYTLPYNYRNYTNFQQIEEFALSVNGAEAELEISNLKLTGRCFGK